MPNRGYIQGRQREWDLVEWYRQRGWIAVRSPGSLGAVDVAAFKAGERPQLVQVKASLSNLFDGFGPAARERLIMEARIAGAVPFLCKWPHGSADQPQFIPEEDWPKPSGRSFPDFFVEEKSGCWLWAKSITPDGYGSLRRIAAGQTHYLAHRFYFAQSHGPIPGGLQIDHLCRVRACVNPEHLEAVTQTENLRRSPVAKLTPEQVRQIRESKETAKKLAVIYGVSRGWIHALRRGERWEDVQQIAA